MSMGWMQAAEDGFAEVRLSLGFCRELPDKGKQYAPFYLPLFFPKVQLFVCSEDLSVLECPFHPCQRHKFKVPRHHAGLQSSSSSDARGSWRRPVKSCCPIKCLGEWLDRGRHMEQLSQQGADRSHDAISIAEELVILF